MVGNWFPTDPASRFDRRGNLLSQELHEALGHDYRVDYLFNTLQVRRWAAQRR